jgi:hypothetical protein
MMLLDYKHSISCAINPRVFKASKGSCNVIPAKAGIQQARSAIL